MNKSTRERIERTLQRTANLKRIYTKNDLSSLLKKKHGAIELLNQSNEQEQKRIEARKKEFTRQVALEYAKIAKDQLLEQCKYDKIIAEHNAKLEYDRRIEAMNHEISQLGSRKSDQSKDSVKVKSQRQQKYESLIDKIMRESKEDTL